MGFMVETTISRDVQRAESGRPGVAACAGRIGVRPFGTERRGEVDAAQDAVRHAAAHLGRDRFRGSSVDARRLERYRGAHRVAPAVRQLDGAGEPARAHDASGRSRKPYRRGAGHGGASRNGQEARGPVLDGHGIQMEAINLWQNMSICSPRATKV
mgnify:CR=1 FL=1